MGKCIAGKGENIYDKSCKNNTDRVIVSECAETARLSGESLENGMRKSIAVSRGGGRKTAVKKSRSGFFRRNPHARLSDVGGE